MRICPKNEPPKSHDFGWLRKRRGIFTVASHFFSNGSVRFDNSACRDARQARFTQSLAFARLAIHHNLETACTISPPRKGLWADCTLSALLLLSACGGSNTTSVSPETQLAAEQYVERRALQAEAVNELLAIVEAYVDGAALDSLVKNDFSMNRKLIQLRQNVNTGLGMAASDDKAAPLNGLPMFSVLHAIETAGQMDQIVKQPSSPKALAQSLADQNLSPADQRRAEIRERYTR